MQGMYVFPSLQVPGFRGSEVESGADVALHPLVDSYEALTKEWSTESACVSYLVTSDSGVEEAVPRLTTESIHHCEDNGLRVHVHWIFLDLDREPHEPWDTEEQALEYVDSVMAALRSKGLDLNAGWYLTRAGMRVFWQLPEGVPIRQWRSFARQFLALCSEAGVPFGEDGSKSTEKWQNMWRLPRSTRSDGVIDQLPMDVESVGTLPWWPDSLQEESIGDVDFDAPSDPPEFDEYPQRSAYERLRGCSFYGALVDGKPLARPGGRENAVFSCAGEIARMLDCDDPSDIYHLMVRSIDSDKSVQNKDGKVDEAPDRHLLWKACCFIAKQQASDKAKRDRELAALMKNVKGATAGKEVDESDDDVRQRLILTTKGASGYFVLDENSGVYHGVVTREQLDLALVEFCPSLAAGIFTDKGALLSSREILVRYGKIVDEVVGVMGQKDTLYEPATNTLRWGVCAVREDLAPEFDQQVNDWLTKLGGKTPDKLLDWLSTVTLIDKPTCALYIDGRASSGKGMLAEGIASLWATTPTLYEDFIANFNDAIARCPVLWADEKLPASRYGDSTSSIVRSVVGNSSFVLRRKYLPSMGIRGCLRLLVTANNADALGIDEALSPADYEAVVSRIGYIETGDAAAKYLESLGGRSATESWVSGDRIAKHLLWLRDHRSVSPGNRFLVEGWETSLHRHLGLRIGHAGAVLEVLAYALSTRVQTTGLLVSGGELFANVTTVQKLWGAALGVDKSPPSRRKLLDALKTFSEDETSYRATIEGKRVRVWKIRSESVLECADELSIGDPSAIKEYLLKLDRGYSVYPDKSE